MQSPATAKALLEECWKIFDGQYFDRRVSTDHSDVPRTQIKNDEQKKDHPFRLCARLCDGVRSCSGSGMDAEQLDAVTEIEPTSQKPAFRRSPSGHPADAVAVRAVRLRDQI